MATQYRIGRVSAPDRTMNPETRRDEKHEPRPQVSLQVGKRYVDVRLTDEELAELAIQAVMALAKVRRAEA